MLTAEQSLEFILARVEDLAAGRKPHERAAYKALLQLTQHWAEPNAGIDDGIALAERIAQDLSDVQRIFADLQQAYMKALFEDAETELRSE